MRWAVALVLLMPFLAHAPELLGIVDTNPLLFVSSLPAHPASAMLGGKPFIDGNAGETTMALGRLAAEDWLAGRLPWWNPYTGVGLPLAAEMQPAAFFLPFVLLLHFAHGVLYLKLSLQVLAGLGMLGFLRALGVGWWAAGLGSVLFELNGTYAWYGDAPCFPIAFLPLLLWGLERAARLVQDGRRGGEAGVALAIAGSLLAGFPETAFVDGLLALGWAAMLAASLRTRLGWPGAIAFARRVVVGGLVGVALSAPALLPFLASLPSSSLGPHADSAAAHMRASYAVSLLFPYVFGLIERDLNLAFWIQSGGYLGVLAVLLAVCAVANRGGMAGGRRVFLAAWLGVSLATVLGVPGITALVRAVPGVGAVYFCRYGLPSAELAACTLAALALQDFAERRPVRLRRVAWGMAALCGIALLLAARHILSDMRHVPDGAWFAGASVLWGAATAAAVLLLLARPATRTRRICLGGVLVVDASVLFAMATLAGLTDARTLDGPIAFLRAHQGLSRAFSTDDTLFANYGAMLERGAVAYEYTPVPLVWSDYVHAHLDAVAMTVNFPSIGESAWDTALLVSARYTAFAAIGVRYVVAPRAVNLFALAGAGGPSLVYRDAHADIFELPHAAPYAEAAGCDLDVATREIMHATCAAPARLVRRELFYPGWRARLDGRPVPIARQDEIFQAVDLPAGRSELVFRYGPPFEGAMWAVFLGGCVLLAGLVWRSRVRGRSTETRHHAATPCRPGD